MFRCVICVCHPTEVTRIVHERQLDQHASPERLCGETSMEVASKPHLKDLCQSIEVTCSDVNNVCQSIEVTCSDVNNVCHFTEVTRTVHERQLN